jgi:hypothetical protein
LTVYALGRKISTAPLVRPTGANNMDFIERIFGFAPDGGNGSLEFLLFAIPLAGAAYLALWARRRMQRKR